MDQIANLVIDLSIDSAEFRNEVPRIKKLLNDAAGDSERSAARMQRFLDKQTEAAPDVRQSGSSDCQQYRVQFRCGEKRSGQYASGGGCGSDATEGGGTGKETA